MASQVQPIQGNEFYVRVADQAGQVGTGNFGALNVASGVKTQSIIATNNLSFNGTAPTNSTTTTGDTNPVQYTNATIGNVKTVTGYAPIYSSVGGTPVSGAFATSAAGGSYFLNKSPGSTAAVNVSDGNLLLIPNSAKIIGVIVTNNGTTLAGGTTYSIGLQASTTFTAAANTQLLNAGTLANVNSGIVLGTAASAFGGAGAAASSVTISNGSGTSNVPSVVTVTTNGTANTAGDLAVTITYL